MIVMQSTPGAALPISAQRLAGTATLRRIRVRNWCDLCCGKDRASSLSVRWNYVGHCDADSAPQERMDHCGSPISGGFNRPSRGAGRRGAVAGA